MMTGTITGDIQAARYRYETALEQLRYEAEEGWARLRAEVGIKAARARSETTAMIVRARAEVDQIAARAHTESVAVLIENGVAPTMLERVPEPVGGRWVYNELTGEWIDLLATPTQRARVLAAAVRGERSGGNGARHDEEEQSLMCPECGADLAKVGIMQDMAGFVAGNGYRCIRCHSALDRDQLIEHGLIDVHPDEHPARRVVEVGPWWRRAGLAAHRGWMRLVGEGR